MISYVKISIEGKRPERIIMIIRSKKLNYKDYKIISSHKIVLKMPYDDYLKLLSVNSIYEINIIKFYGSFKYFNFIKNNVSFIISIIISLLILFIISNTCFDINIIHNDKQIRRLISDELNDNNIKKYGLIPNFNKRRTIINNIIKHNKDSIEWMEIERQGSKLIIKVTERKNNKKEQVTENRHVVAKKSGIIISITADKGVILKKKNDYVYEGEVLISGDIIKDDTVKGQVPATGKVLAETWYKVSVTYPLHYKEVTYLEEVKNNVIIEFFNREYSLRKNYESSYLERRKRVIRENVFPFSINIEKQRKTKVTDEVLSDEEAVKKAIFVAKKKIQKKLSKEEYIISEKTLNFVRKGSKIKVDVFFKICEDITSYRAVTPITITDDIINE